MSGSTPDRWRLAFLAAPGVALVGCASVSEPPRDLATRHVGVPPQYAEQRGEGVEGADVVGAGWLPSLGDPVLEGLVREAWAHNPDLYVAAARVEEAGASLREAGSYLTPGVEGAGGGSYTNYGG
ncbi:MAG: hypothetical protein ACIARR_02990, partial [Phycisphaerales bacterium JB059]